MARTNRNLHWLIPILLAPAVLQAQSEQAGSIARTLAPTSKHAEAVRHLNDGYDALMAQSFSEGARRLDGALAEDIGLGLARALRARARGGPTMVAETERAAVDAAAGSAAEAVLALAIRETAAGRANNARHLFDAAAALAPDDPRLALEAALSRSGAERVSMLRGVAKRYKEYTPAKYWLTLHLTSSPFGDIPQADLDDALAVAQEALRLAPNAASSHTMMALVLTRHGRDDEATTHLGHATAMPGSGHYSHVLSAEIASRRGDFASMRRSLDSAAALAANVDQVSVYRRARALVNLHEGLLPETIRELDALASADDAAGRRGAAATDHLWLALMSGAARDNAAIERHLSEARRLGSTGPILLENQTIIYYLAGNATSARKSLEGYTEATARDTSTARREALARLTGLVLIAEGKPREAIELLKRGGANPYAQLGLIEAYQTAGDRKAAAAERSAFLARRNFSFNSTAMPIGKYRLKATTQ